MSRVHFDDVTGSAELSGSERAFMGVMCGELFALSMSPQTVYDFDRNIFRLLFKGEKDSYLFHDRDRYKQSIETHLKVIMGGTFHLDGEELDHFTLALNTMNAVGGRPLKLMARIHGQCEIHAYVRGENRGWLADLIEEGRGNGLFRADRGWEGVASFLRERDSETVVMSYSVCRRFPSPYEIDEDLGDEEGDAFYQLPKEEQWEKGLAYLYSQPLLEIKPDGFDSYFFGDGINGYQLREALEKKLAGAA